VRELNVGYIQLIQTMIGPRKLILNFERREWVIDRVFCGIKWVY